MTKRFWVWLLLVTAVSAAPLRSQLQNTLARNAALHRFACQNVLNQLTPGFRSHCILAALNAPDHPRLQQSQGEILVTHGATDLALVGEGFLALEGGRCSRDGRLHWQGGTLTHSSGRAVLGYPLNGQGRRISTTPGPIRSRLACQLRPTVVHVTEHLDEVTGASYETVRELFALAIVTFGRPEELEVGEGLTLLRSTSRSGPPRWGFAEDGRAGRLEMGCLELPNTDLNEQAEVALALRNLAGWPARPAVAWGPTPVPHFEAREARPLDLQSGPLRWPLPAGDDLRAQLLTRVQQNRCLLRELQLNMAHQFTPGYRGLQPLVRSPDGAPHLDTTRGQIFKTQTATHLALRAEGCFVLGRNTIDGPRRAYSRDGRFTLSDAHLRNAFGDDVLGYPLDPHGNLSGGLASIRLGPDGNRFSNFLFDEFGTLSGVDVQIDPVTGERSEQTTPLARVALARFAHPELLRPQPRPTLFEATSAAGIPTLGLPGQLRLPTVVPGSLELSNVDFAQQGRSMQLVRRYNQLLGPFALSPP